MVKKIINRPCLKIWWMNSDCPFGYFSIKKKMETLGYVAYFGKLRVSFGLNGQRAEEINKKLALAMESLDVNLLNKINKKSTREPIVRKIQPAPRNTINSPRKQLTFYDNIPSIKLPEPKPVNPVDLTNMEFFEKGN